MDSSVVTALMAERRASRSGRSRSASTTGAYDELPYARAVAQQFGTDHTEEIVRLDAIELLPDLADALRRAVRRLVGDPDLPRRPDRRPRPQGRPDRRRRRRDLRRLRRATAATGCSAPSTSVAPAHVPRASAAARAYLRAGRAASTGSGGAADAGGAVRLDRRRALRRADDADRRRTPGRAARRRTARGPGRATCSDVLAGGPKRRARPDPPGRPPDLSARGPPRQDGPRHDGQLARGSRPAARPRARRVRRRGSRSSARSTAATPRSSCARSPSGSCRPSSSTVRRWASASRSATGSAGPSATASRRSSWRPTPRSATILDRLAADACWPSIGPARSTTPRGSGSCSCSSLGAALAARSRRATPA